MNILYFMSHIFIVRCVAVLSSATRHVLPREFGRKWGTECVITRFPLPTPLCMEYSVTLKKKISKLNCEAKVCVINSMCCLVERPNLKNYLSFRIGKNILYQIKNFVVTHFTCCQSYFGHLKIVKHHSS